MAMGLLETIVVVYLRELYYPEGFNFPLKLMTPDTIGIELLRELATILMLLTVGILTGKNLSTRFAWFIYAFAVWDIFYYVFLKLLLGWPASLLTWDILFLIPVTWVGPVLGPVINSLTMIFLAIALLRRSRFETFRISRYDWGLLIVGSVIVIASYTREYSIFMLSRFSTGELLFPKEPEKLMEYAGTFIPGTFDWMLFLSGVAIHWIVIGRLLLQKEKL
jgi:hypothetical protein